MAISFRFGLGLMANGCLERASISRSQMALPKAQSGLSSEDGSEDGSGDELRTDLIASTLPGPLGTRIRRSVMMPLSIATSAARMRSWGIPKNFMAERMIHWLEEETAQTSHLDFRRRSTSSCISGKVLGAIAFAK